MQSNLAFLGSRIKIWKGMVGEHEISMHLNCLISFG